MYLSLKNRTQPYFIERIDGPAHGVDPRDPAIRLLGAPGGANAKGEQAILYRLLERIESFRDQLVDRIDHRVRTVAATALAGTSAGRHTIKWPTQEEGLDRRWRPQRGSRGDHGFAWPTIRILY